MAKVDYRKDAWTDTNQPSIITGEKHIIPTSSPYVVRLEEMPLKEVPSSIALKLCDILATAITTVDGTTVVVGNGAWWRANDVLMIDSEAMQVTGDPSGNTLTVTRGYNGTTPTTHLAGADVLLDAKFTEVAAAPGEREFWPDYNTTVEDDPNWNRGDLQFNSAQAGMRVSVDYKGMGNFADKYLDVSDIAPALRHFGDGSEGDFYSTENFNLGGLHQYRNFVLNSGHTLTSNEPITIIRCTGTCIIDGTISTVNQGSAGGAQASVGGSVNPGMPGTGGGEGGGPRVSAVDSGIFGYAGIMVAEGSSTPNATMQDIMLRSGLAATMVGGGGASGTPGSSQGQTGGAGGKGAGALVVIAKNIKFTGTINANGSNGASSWRNGRGGGGGTVILGAKNWWADSGTINVAGGTGSAAGGAGWYRKLRL